MKTNDRSCGWGALVLVAAAALAGPWCGPTRAEDASTARTDRIQIEVSEGEAGGEAQGAPRRTRHGQQISVFRSIHIASDEVVYGDLVCIGCDAVIEGEVSDDVVVIAGTLRFSGRAGHDLVSVLSDLQLEKGAEVARELVNVLGSLEDRGASVGSSRVNIEPFTHVPGVDGVLGFVTAVLLWFKVLRILITFLVLLLLALVVPERIRAIGEEAPVRYGLAILAGLGGYVSLWVMTALLVVSIVGIPFALALHPVFLTMKVLGLAGLFHFLGRRLGSSMGREMSLLGAILLAFVPFAALLLLPHFLGLPGLAIALAMRLAFWALVELPAVGLVLLTRAGGRPRRIAPAVPLPPVVEPSPV